MYTCASCTIIHNILYMYIYCIHGYRKKIFTIMYFDCTEEDKDTVSLPRRVKTEKIENGGDERIVCEDHSIALASKKVKIEHVHKNERAVLPKAFSTDHSKHECHSRSLYQVQASPHCTNEGFEYDHEFNTPNAEELADEYQYADHASMCSPEIQQEDPLECSTNEVENSYGSMLKPKKNSSYLHALSCQKNVDVDSSRTLCKGTSGSIKWSDFLIKISMVHSDVISVSYVCDVSFDKVNIKLV